MGYLTDVTDAQWAWIEPMFPPQEGRGRRRTVSLRRVIDALMYHDRTGCQWRYLAPPRASEGDIRTRAYQLLKEFPNAPYYPLLCLNLIYSVLRISFCEVHVPQNAVRPSSSPQ